MPTRYALLILCTAALLAGAWLFVPVSSTPHEPLPVWHEPLGQEQLHAEDTEAQIPAPAQATLLVSEHRYPISLAAEKTVLAAMQELASSGAFTFAGREFPSLGFFVESINGVQNAGGMYWILYRNGAQSQIGVSSASISPGDVIEWRYE